MERLAHRALTCAAALASTLVSGLSPGVERPSPTQQQQSLETTAFVDDAVPSSSSLLLPFSRCGGGARGVFAITTHPLPFSVLTVRGSVVADDGEGACGGERGPFTSIEEFHRRVEDLAHDFKSFNPHNVRDIKNVMSRAWYDEQLLIWMCGDATRLFRSLVPNELERKAEWAVVVALLAYDSHFWERMALNYLMKIRHKFRLIEKKGGEGEQENGAAEDHEWTKLPFPKRETVRRSLAAARRTTTTTATTTPLPNCDGASLSHDGGVVERNSLRSSADDCKRVVVAARDSLITRPEFIRPEGILIPPSSRFRTSTASCIKTLTPTKRGSSAGDARGSLTSSRTSSTGGSSGGGLVKKRKGSIISDSNNDDYDDDDESTPDIIDFGTLWGDQGIPTAFAALLLRHPELLTWKGFQQVESVIRRRQKEIHEAHCEMYGDSEEIHTIWPATNKYEKAAFLRACGLHQEGVKEWKGIDFGPESKEERALERARWEIEHQYAKSEDAISRYPDDQLDFGKAVANLHSALEKYFACAGDNAVAMLQKARKMMPAASSEGRSSDVLLGKGRRRRAASKSDPVDEDQWKRAVLACRTGELEFGRKLPSS